MAAKKVVAKKLVVQRSKPDLGDEALERLSAQMPTHELNESSGDSSDWPTGIKMDSLEHRGYIVVYHKATREPSVILADALGKQLKKVDPDTGQLAFQLDKPKQSPYRGVLKCRLHADDPDRSKHDQFGFAHCKKSNIPTEYQRNMHMIRKHKQEWAAIQADKAERERAETREFQSQLMAAVRSGTPAAAAVAATIGSD
jgi:hypothetical protein